MTYSVVASNVGNTQIIVASDSVQANALTNTTSAVAVSVAIDYSSYFERIASAVENISHNSNTMVTLLTSLNSNTGTIATSMSNLSALANTTGIRMIGPYEEFNGASIYQFLIDQGHALDTKDNVDEYTQGLAKQKMVDYATKLKEYSKF